VSENAAYAKLVDLAAAYEELCPASQAVMRDVFGYSNEVDASWTQIKASQSAAVLPAEPVGLVRLPSQAMVLGQSWRLMVGGVWAAEQLHYRPPALPRPEVLAVPHAKPCEAVSDEVILVARFGDGTWGHWVGELLPKVALAERHFPGRFRYAVPKWAYRSDPLGRRMAESLAFYGVPESRILLLENGRDYCFGQLHAITPVWQGRAMHPCVLQVMRDALPREPLGARRVALLRGDNTRRQIGNIEAVRAVLDRHGFACIDIAFASFAEQVGIFAAARTIFSILGSSLTGLLYAPDGVGVVAVSPEGFTDRFFSGMLQQKRSARFFSVAGPICDLDSRMRRDSGFEVPLSALEEALLLAFGGESLAGGAA
jgi:hypothetical protein